MQSNWQDELAGLLAAYFGGRSVERGVAEMVFVSRQRDDYHGRFLAALQAGVLAAERDDAAVLRVIDTGLRPFLTDTEAARQLLQRILDEYLRQYGASTGQRIRVDLRTLPVWAQYTVAAILAVLVMGLAWTVGRSRPVGLAVLLSIAGSVVLLVLVYLALRFALTKESRRQRPRR